MAKKKFTNIGTILKQRPNPNYPNDEDKYYLKLEQRQDKNGNIIGDKVFPITLANGKKLNSGDILTMFSKKTQLNKLVQEGRMEPETAEKISSFVKFDVCVSEQVEDNGTQSESNSGVDF